MDTEFYNSIFGIFSLLNSATFWWLAIGLVAVVLSQKEKKKRKKK